MPDHQIALEIMKGGTRSLLEAYRLSYIIMIAAASGGSLVYQFGSFVGETGVFAFESEYCTHVVQSPTWSLP